MSDSVYARLLLFFLRIRRPPRSTLFPTRRSSDLGSACARLPQKVPRVRIGWWAIWRTTVASSSPRDRKSTRLNSSHITISYAVFCLKKKKQTKHITQSPANTHNTVTYHCTVHTTE